MHIFCQQTSLKYGKELTVGVEKSSQSEPLDQELQVTGCKPLSKVTDAFTSSTSCCSTKAHQSCTSKLETGQCLPDFIKTAVVPFLCFETSVACNIKVHLQFCLASLTASYSESVTIKSCDVPFQPCNFQKIGIKWKRSRSLTYSLTTVSNCSFKTDVMF